MTTILPPNPDLSMLYNLVARVDEKIDGLSTSIFQTFVPRNEIDARFAEARHDRTALHTDLDRLGTRMEAAERQRVLDRRWAIGTAIAILTFVAALATIFIK